MKVHLKRLDEQVIVITGASSGIGLATARMAAKKGARLVLAARNGDALQQLVEEIRNHGGEATYATADVGREEDARAIAEEARRAFGGFDTWVNNAGVTVYGTLEEVPVEDMRRLFETNFWGVVYGSRIACEELRRHGGALINIGSTLSDRAIPIQGIYCASKHAVKGFTDALRMELEADGAPVSVTLIKPSGIDTPYALHAKNYTDGEPKLPPPAYTPETVAHAILHCAEHPTRDVFVGASGKALAAIGYHAPGLTDKVMAKLFPALQTYNRPPRPREQNGLYSAAGSLEERGNYEGFVMGTSLYTHAALHPMITGAALLGAGALATAFWRSRS